MPIFEYLCEDCGTKFEKLVRRAGADDTLCPSCGQNHLKQEFSTFSAHATSGHANGAPQEMMPSCPGGMCRTPDLCGRN
jgi:putative FmdB family regulatory protein